MFSPKTSQEKESYYKAFGKQFFTILDIKNLNLKTQNFTLTSKENQRPIKSEIDLRSSIEEIADAFGTKKSSTKAMSSASVSGIVLVSKKEKEQIKFATERAKKASGFQKAIQVFKELCPKRLARVIESITQFISKGVSKINSFVHRNKNKGATRSL